MSLDNMARASVRFTRADGSGGELECRRGDFATLIDIVQRHFGEPHWLDGPELPRKSP